MKIEKKVESACVVALTITADAEEIKPICKKVLSRFMREAEIPGFRKGKIPEAVLRARFANEIEQMIRQDVFEDVVPKAIKEEKLTMVAVTEAPEFEVKEATGCKITVRVEVKPEFKLPKYKQLTLKKVATEITDAMVTDAIESTRRGYASFEAAQEGDAIADGDFVCMDYSGSLDGKPLSEVVPDDKAVCSAQGFWVQVEEGRFLPEILKALKGMKAGEEKADIKVKFPNEQAPEALKGKKCLYNLKVQSFRRRILPDDATLAQKTGMADFEALKKDVRERLTTEAEVRDLEARRDEAMKKILAKADFEVPESLVKEQTQQTLQSFAERAMYSGVPSDYFEKNREKILKEADEQARRSIRWAYIVAEIAKAENIEASDEEVSQRIAVMADTMNARGGKDQITAADLEARYRKSDMYERVRNALASEKAMDFILKEAK